MPGGLTTYPPVRSVANRTGDVLLATSDISGLPTTTVAGHVASFSNTTGTLQDSGVVLSTLVPETDGTWTPTDASGAALTFTANTGFYRKIGKLVFVWGALTYPTTASAVQAVIGSLPFTASNSGVNQVGVVHFLASAGGNNAAFVVAKNATTMAAATLSANTAINNVVFTGATLIFWGMYPTDV